MFSAQTLPFDAFFRQAVRLENRQCDQRRYQSHQNIVVHMDPPERLQSQLVQRSPPTGQPHSSAPPKKTDFPQLMISKIRVEPLAESLPQLLQAFARAL